MVANTAARSRVGHHCGHVMRRTGGRAMGSRTTAATIWRTATTPAGPIAANACAPTAAPTWLLMPLPSIVTIPRRTDREVSPGTSPTVASLRGGRVAASVMPSGSFGPMMRQP